MASNLTQAVDEIAAHFTNEVEALKVEMNEKLADIETKIVATGRNSKVRLWVSIGAGVIVLIFLAVIFFGRRGGSLDQSAIDERIKLRDSIAAMKANQEASKAAAVEQVEAEKKELQAENDRLTQAFITNQEKHVIINRKNENNNSIVRAIDNPDSLRRAAFGN